MNRAIDQLFSMFDIHPVLVDIGASGSPLDIWKQIARHSIYIGFDPDEREIHELKDGSFFRATIVNKAVTSEKDCDAVKFYLTASPYCSSTLDPDQASLSEYLFSDLFKVEKQVQVPAVSLQEVMNSLSLSTVDWFKTDSQGTDLRLFTSLQPGIRSRVLAVDIEPGLMDAYVGEDLFVDAHRELIRGGFWLSRLNIRGAVRMRRSSLDALTGRNREVNDGFVAKAVRSSPGWCEARYLRTIDWLVQSGFQERDFVLLWSFAVLDGQFGFGFDLGNEYERVFGDGKVAQTLKEESVALMKRAYRIRHSLPIRLVAGAKRRLERIWDNCLRG